MATQICPECHSSFTAVRGAAGTVVRCAKCAARARAASPLPQALPPKRKKPASPESTDIHQTLDRPPVRDANLIAELHDQPTIEFVPTPNSSSPPTLVSPPPTRAGTTRVQPMASPATATGRQLGPYEIISEIGRGGMGLVLKGRDEALKREVAIKTLLPDARRNPTHEMRFIQEAQIAGQLEHPGIAPVHLLSWDERGNGFFSMKLVAGKTLEQILDNWHKKDSQIRAEYPLPRLISIFERVCETIGFAHSHGVVHRDLKPANVMIGEYGEVWVLDWGLAKVLGQPDVREEPAPKPDRQRGSKSSTTPAASASSKASGMSAAAAAATKGSSKNLSTLESNMTLDGTVVGTPGYMAPEQTAGEAIDEGVDIFGLGGLLYEMLCGHAPFTGKSVKELLVNSARGDIKRIPRTVHGRTVPKALSAIAYQCLEFNRSDRYATTADLLKDLRAYAAGEPVSAMEEGPADRIKRFARRHGRALGLAASIGAVMVAVLIAAGITVWRQDLVTREEQSKRLQAEVDKKNAEMGREAERTQRMQAELEKQKVLNAGAEKAQRRLKAFEPYTEAMDLLMRGQLPERAVTLLRGALQLDPEFEEAQYALGEALRNAGLPREAGAAYLKADELSRKLGGKPNIKALVSAGFTFDDAGYYSEAEDAFGTADKDGANDPLAVVGRVFRTGHTRRLHEGLKLAEGALKDAPHLWETHFAYGYALLEAAQEGILPRNPTIPNALIEMRKALELSPRQGEVANWLAMGLARSGKFDEAMEWSGKAIAMEPKNGNRYYQRWSLGQEMGRTELCQKDIADARKYGISSSVQLLYEALMASKANDLERTFKVMGQLLKETRDWPTFVANYLITGINLGRTDEIQPLFKRWSEAYPDYWCVRMLRAQMLMKTDLPAAMREIDEGLKYNPYQTKLFDFRGQMLFLTGHTAEALETFEKSLTVEPGNLRAAGEKLHCLVALNRLDEAEAWLAKMKIDFARSLPDVKKYEEKYMEAKKRN